MENNTNNSIFNFNIDEESRSNLTSLAQWINLNAITGLVSAALSVISFIVTMNQLSRYGSSAAGPGVAGMMLGLAISLLLNILLLMSASNLKKALEGESQPHFLTGLNKLATYFKVVGILAIIVIVFFSFAMLVILLAAGSRGF